jgi:DNA-binding NtrC family response regulator
MQLHIIDNDPSVRKALHMGMSGEGWVITATGTEMLNGDTKMAVHDYDVLIADLDSDDLEYFSKIRKLKRQQPNLIVIGMTRGKSMDYLSDEQMNFVNVCYTKPLHLSMLKKAINLELKKLALPQKSQIT